MKKSYRSDEENKKINTRLNKIDGQIKGIQKMVNTDRECEEILIQLAAVTKATKSLANYILENHLYSCITNEFENGNLDTLDEVCNLFKRFQ